MSDVNIFFFFLTKLVEHAIAVFTALPLLFPSGSAAPKKQVPISEALFHVLTVSFTLSSDKLITGYYIVNKILS